MRVMDPKGQLCIILDRSLLSRRIGLRMAYHSWIDVRRRMRQVLTGIALATGLMGSAALAADVATVSRFEAARLQTGRAISRLADQGLGYSVLHDAPRGPQGSYRVHVTCAIDESFMQTYCPTQVYVSACPRARITCGGGTQEVRALRLKY